MRGLLGDRKEGRVDGLSVIVYIVTAGVGTVCGGWGASPGILLVEGRYCVFFEGTIRCM